MSRLLAGPKYSALAAVFPINIQGWFPLALIDLISLLSKGLSSRVFTSPVIRKHQFFDAQPLQSNSHIYTWQLEKL